MKLRFFIIFLVLGFFTLLHETAFGQYAAWGTGMNMAYPQCPYEMGGSELSELNAEVKEAKREARIAERDLEKMKSKVGTGSRDDYYIDFDGNDIKDFFIDFITNEKKCSDVIDICSKIQSQTAEQNNQNKRHPCKVSTEVQGPTPAICNGTEVDYDKLCGINGFYNQKTEKGKTADVNRSVRSCKTWTKDLKRAIKDVKEANDEYDKAKEEYDKAKWEAKEEEREARRAIRRGEDPPESTYCVGCTYGRRRSQKVDKVALGVGVVMDYLMMRANRKNLHTVVNKNAELGWGTDPNVTNPWYGFGYGFPFATMSALSGGGGGGGFYGGVYGGIGAGAWGCAGVNGLGSPYGPAGYMTPYGPNMNPYGQVPGIWGGGGIGAGFPGYNPALAMGFMPGYPPWGMMGPWAGASAGIGMGGFPLGLAAGAGIGIGMNPMMMNPMMMGGMGGMGMNPGLLAGGIGLGGLPFGMAGMGMGMPGMMGGMGMGMPPYGGFGGVPGIGGPYGGFGMGGGLGGPFGGMGGPMGGSIFGPGSGLGLQYQMQMYQMQMQMQQQYMEMYQRQQQNQMMQYQALQQVTMEMQTLQQRYYQIMYGGGLGIGAGFGASLGGSGPFGNSPVTNTTNGPFNNNQPIR